MNKQVVCLFHRGFKLFPRGFKQIEALNQDGYDVEIICTSRSDLPKTSHHEGVPIERIPIPWPEFAPLKPFAMLLAVALLYRRARERNDVDVFHCFGVYSLFAGVFLSLSRNSALTYDAFEDYYYQTERSNVLGPFSWIPAKVVQFVEGWLVARTDHVFLVPSADNILEERFGRVTDQFTTVGNVPKLSEENLDTDPELESKHKNKITILYVGGMVRQKGSLKMLHVADYVLNRTEKPIEFLFIGGFSDDSEKQAQNLAKRPLLSNSVELLGAIPYDKVEPYMAISDIALHLYQPTPWHLQSRGSSKLFRYMAAGLPIVVSNFPGIGTIVSDSNCGIPVNPEKIADAGEAILRLVDDESMRNELGNNGIEAFRSQYNWDIEKRKFLCSFSDVVNSKESYPY